MLSLLFVVWCHLVICVQFLKSLIMLCKSIQIYFIKWISKYNKIHVCIKHNMKSIFKKFVDQLNLLISNPVRRTLSLSCFAIKTLEHDFYSSCKCLFRCFHFFQKENTQNTYTNSNPIIKFHFKIITRITRIMYMKTKKMNIEEWMLAI